VPVRRAARLPPHAGPGLGGLEGRKVRARQVRSGEGLEDRIFLQGIGFHAYHGVYAEERVEGQRFEVDLDIWRSCRAAGRSDRLDDTIDYAGLAALVVEVGTREPYSLLERLAAVLAEAILDRHPELRLRVTVHKFPHSLAGAPREAGVSILRGPRG